MLLFVTLELRCPRCHNCGAHKPTAARGARKTAVMERDSRDKSSYRVARCLGTVTGSICRGVCSIVPFMSPANVKENDMGERVHHIEFDPWTAREPDMEERSEYEPAPVSDILSGLDFQNGVQLAETEVCVKDLHSELTAVRKKALDRICKLPKPVAVEILQRLLDTKLDSIRIIQVLNALSVLNDDAGMEKNRFLAFLGHERPAVRLAALAAVSKYEDEESFSVLSASIEDPHAQVRRQALNLLSWVYGHGSAPAVLAMLHDVDKNVKGRAIYLCASLRLREAISPLISFLSDPDKEIQERAVESLREITGQHFAFRASASAKSRKEAIEAWCSWWRSNQATFQT